jgi:hypothetical protein
MICPNCGQETTDDFCQWCGYPLMKGRPVRRQKAKKEAEEKVKREAEEAKKAKRVEGVKEKGKKEAKEAKKEVKKKAEEAEPAAVAKLYKGMVELMIVPPVDLGQLENLGKALRQVENLRLVLVGGSVDEGNRIVVSAEEPIPLLRILGEMPAVEQVAKKGSEIQVTLKTK